MSSYFDGNYSKLLIAGGIVTAVYIFFSPNIRSVRDTPFMKVDMFHPSEKYGANDQSYIIFPRNEYYPRVSVISFDEDYNRIKNAPEDKQLTIVLDHHNIPLEWCKKNTQTSYEA